MEADFERGDKEVVPDVVGDEGTFALPFGHVVDDGWWRLGFLAVGAANDVAVAVGEVEVDFVRVFKESFVGIVGVAFPDHFGDAVDFGQTGFAAFFVDKEGVDVEAAADGVGDGEGGAFVEDFAEFTLDAVEADADDDVFQGFGFWGGFGFFFDWGWRWLRGFVIREDAFGNPVDGDHGEAVFVGFGPVEFFTDSVNERARGVAGFMAGPAIGFSGGRVFVGP